MANTNIIDLPTEIIQSFIFKYLADVDVYNLGRTGNSRLKEISEDYVQIGKF